MNRISSIVIRRLIWRIKWSRDEPEEEKAHGLCYKTEHEIVIDPQERPQCLLNTIIHELLHAIIAELRGPYIPPDAVSAYDIAAKAGCSRYKATEFLKAEVEEGRMRTAMKAVNNTLTRFYWPAG